MTKNIHEEVTAKIIAAIESGTAGKWTCPWDRTGANGRFPLTPLRITGQGYQGINVLILWSAAYERGYKARHWLTYKQAQELGGNVKKGEKAEHVVYVGRAEDKKAPKDENGKAKTFSFLKTYAVFNVEQCEGLPAHLYPAPEAPRVPIKWDNVAELEAFAANTRIKVEVGGVRASYSPILDRVQMPDRDRFPAPEAYYATLWHEFTHATGASHRVGRDLSGRFGDVAYAAEELIAELGSAFLCAHLGIDKEPREDHASYIKTWLELLKSDSKAIFTAASAAQTAINWIIAQQPAAAIQEDETAEAA